MTKKLRITKRAKHHSTRSLMAGCGRNWDNLCGARN